MKATFVRYSICICGHPDAVPIGTIYEVDPKRKAPFVFKCGWCGEGPENRRHLDREQA